jgi:hypothetical protein
VKSVNEGVGRIPWPHTASERERTAAQQRDATDKAL